MFKLIFSVAAVTALAQLLQLISQPLLIYLYTKESFGYLSLVVSIITFMSIICNFQFNNLILISKKNIPSIFSSGMIISFVLELICFVFLIILSWFIFKENRIVLLALMMLYVVFYCFNVLFRAVLLSNNQNKMYSYGILIRSIAVVGGQILFSYYNKSLGLVLGVVLSEFVLVLYGLTFYKNNIGFNLNLKESVATFVENKKFLIIGTVQELVSTSMFISPLLLVTYKFSYSIGGEFSVIHKLVWGPAFLLTQVVSPILLQYVSKDDFKDKFLFNQRMSILFFCVASIVAYYGCEFVFGLIIKSDWHNAIWMSKYIAVWVLSFIMVLPYRVLLRAERKQSIQFFVDLVILLLFFSILFVNFSLQQYILLLVFLGVLGNFLIMLVGGGLARERGWL